MILVLGGRISFYFIGGFYFLVFFLGWSLGLSGMG